MPFVSGWNGTLFIPGGAATQAILMSVYRTLPLRGLRPTLRSVYSPFVPAIELLSRLQPPGHVEQRSATLVSLT